MSGMGILVYMVSVGYEDKKRKPLEVDADLGAATTPIVAANPDPESIVGIPSVS